MSRVHLDFDAKGALTPRSIEAWAETFEQQNPNAPDKTIIPPDEVITRHAISLLDEIVNGTAAAFTPGVTIGEGGMGIVRAAEQRAMARDVAIKTLREGVGGARATSSLLREAWVTGMLEHPSIIPVYDISLDEERRPQIVLKKVEGESWDKLAHAPDAVEARYGAEDAREWNLRVLLQVMNAVAFAHSRGILHRDLKPENVMVGEFGEVYLVDWGIAVSLDDDHQGRVALARDATQAAGTPNYMAPEMLGRGALSERTDVYLLGATLYELVTGSAPHHAPSYSEVAKKIIASRPSFPPDASPELVAIVRRAMQPNAEERYPDVRSMQRDLDDYLSHRGSRRLARRAQEHLVALAEAAESDDYPRAQSTFDEARFGFRAALVEWEDNPIAKRGLADLAEQMAELELARGNPEAAAVALSASPTVSSEVRERVAGAVSDRRETSQRLSKLSSDMNSETGSRVRMALAVAFGITWVVVPVIGWHLENATTRVFRPNDSIYVLSPLIQVVLGGVFAFVTRRSPMWTRINRAMALAGLYGLAAHALYAYIATRMDFAVEQSSMMFMAVCASITTTIAVALEPRLWWSALGYVLGACLMSVIPGDRQVVSASAHALVLLNLVVVSRSPREPS